jgi:hypothetical protein
MITFALLAGLLGSPLASIPMLAAQEPIELEIDPTTRMPVGPAVAPRGPLLDPRDLPEVVREHLDVVTGLEGFDLSLTALFVRYLAFVVEREGLDPIYHPHAEALRDDRNERLGGLLASLDPGAPGEPVHAVVYLDTGRRLFREEPMRLRVERAPRLRFAPVGPELFAELALLERYIAGLGPDMARDEATHLKEAAERVEVNPIKDPWFLHATTQLLFLSMGA